MPYIHPAGYPSTPIKKQSEQSPSTASPSSRVSPHIRPSPRTTPASPASSLLPASKHRHIHRIPPPAILSPIVDITHSAIHLTLKSEAGSTLSTQVDQLLSRHLHHTPPGPQSGVANTAHVSSGNPDIFNEESQGARDDIAAMSPPSLPPKVPAKTAQSPADSPAGPRQMASPGVAPARRPLPRPPTSTQEHTPHQYPASYGPSISKIRSFPAQLPSASNSPYYGLPPGAAHLPSSLMPGRQGLGYGHPHAATANGASSNAQPWTQGQQRKDQPSVTAQQNTVSRTFAKGGASVFLHKGFFDLLSVSPYTTAAGADIFEAEYGQGWMGDRPVVPNAGRAVTSPFYIQSSRKESLSPPQAKGYRRISVEMISKPTGFA